MLLYLNLLEKTGDLWTLERAYTYLRTDKRVNTNKYAYVLMRGNSLLILKHSFFLCIKYFVRKLCVIVS